MEGWSWWGGKWMIIRGCGHFLASLSQAIWVFGRFRLHCDYSGKVIVSKPPLWHWESLLRWNQRHPRVSRWSSFFSFALPSLWSSWCPCVRSPCCLLPCLTAALCFAPLLSSKDRNHVREQLMPSLRAEQVGAHWTHADLLNNCVQLSPRPYLLGWEHARHWYRQKGNGNK